MLKCVRFSIKLQSCQYRNSQCGDTGVFLQLAFQRDSIIIMDKTDHHTEMGWIYGIFFVIEILEYLKTPEGLLE